jgi:hypothetical protein
MHSDQHAECPNPRGFAPLIFEPLLEDLVEAHTESKSS